MFALGFFSKHATEKGLLVGTFTGFLVVWWVAVNTDVAWPWYCLIGAVSNFGVSVLASLLIDGRQATWSPYTIRGQIEHFSREGLVEKDGGWYRVPGRVDRISWWLLVFFAVVLLFLYLLQTFVHGVIQ